MPRYPIRAGDTVYVPGGVIHAFGPDTLIFEVQQTSDLTQTVMPTDLYGNRYSHATWEARINATLDELRAGYRPQPTAGLALPSEGPNRRVVGCAGPHFALERWTLTAPHRAAAHPRRCLTLSSVGGRVRIEHASGEETLGRAESCILPAAIGDVRIVPVGDSEDDGETSLIACYVPDLAVDIVAPLRAAGHADDAIRALGDVGT